MKVREMEEINALSKVGPVGAEPLAFLNLLTLKCRPQKKKKGGDGRS